MLPGMIMCQAHSGISVKWPTVTLKFGLHIMAMFDEGCRMLTAAAKISEQVARDWLKRQAIWQIYLPAPHHIPRPMCDEDRPNAVHQADLLYLPHDRVGIGRKAKTLRYALTMWMLPLATKRLSL